MSVSREIQRNGYRIITTPITDGLEEGDLGDWSTLKGLQIENPLRKKKRLVGVSANGKIQKVIAVWEIFPDSLLK